MKHISRWSILGMIAGAVFSIVSFIQYYMLHRDIDRVIAYPVIGLLIIAVSWLYNQNMHLNSTLEGLEEYIVDKKYENGKKE